MSPDGRPSPDPDDRLRFCFKSARIRKEGHRYPSFTGPDGVIGDLMKVASGIGTLMPEYAT